jgi:hypothetical protein
MCTPPARKSGILRRIPLPPFVAIVLGTTLTEKNMWKTVIVMANFVLPTVAATAAHAPAQNAATPYTKLAPIDQYLMADQNAEIALARTAAPESISDNAEIRVLKSTGFETAVQGKNGFVCIVERSWTSAPEADRWNPKVRTPICYNAAAARSYLPRSLKTTKLALAGRTAEQIDQAMVAAIDSKELPAIESGAMCYMMSKLGFGGDEIPHWPSHLMFYYPEMDPASWGAGLSGSPVLASSSSAQHLTEFVLLVQRWPDGTEARKVPGHHH